MEKGFHPISGEPVFLATVKEKEVIDVALQLLLETSLRSSESGAK